MKNLIIGFLISCLIHLLSFYFFLIQRKPEEKSVELNPIALYPELSVSRFSIANPNPIENSVTLPPGQSSTEKSENGVDVRSSSGQANPKVQSVESAGPNGIEYSQESRFVPVPDTSSSMLYSRPRPSGTFKEALVGARQSRENVKKKVLSWFFSTAPASGSSNPDPAADYLKKQRGSSPILAMPGIQSLDKKKVEQNPPQFNFLPNRVQLSAMASLYRMKQGTQTDIYAAMDVSLLVTAEGLDSNLDFLVKKGFLKRKKISPENLLTLFGVASVEMSRKNKLNPLYQYTPTVDRTILISYFQAQIYLLKEKTQTSPSDSRYIERQIDNLEDMIQMLIQNT